MAMGEIMGHEQAQDLPSPGLAAAALPDRLARGPSGVLSAGSDRLAGSRSHSPALPPEERPRREGLRPQDDGCADSVRLLRRDAVVTKDREDLLRGDAVTGTEREPAAGPNSDQ